MYVPATFGWSMAGKVIDEGPVPMMSVEQQDGFVAASLQAFWDMAVNDPKVAGFCPWHFNLRGNAQR